VEYKYRPKTKEELIEAICTEIFIVQGSHGSPNWKADLNCVDVSQITDLRGLFGKNGEAPPLPKQFINAEERRLWHFYGNVSKWNVKNVTDFQKMLASEGNKRLFPDIGDWEINPGLDKEKSFYSFINMFDPINLGVAVFLKENNIEVSDYFGTDVTSYIHYVCDDNRPCLGLPEEIYSLKTLQKAVNLGINCYPDYMFSALLRADKDLKDFFKNPADNELIDEIDYEYALMYIAAFYFLEKDFQRDKTFRENIVKKFGISKEELKRSFNRLLDMKVSNAFVAKNIDKVKDVGNLNSFEQIYDFIAKEKNIGYEERINFLSLKLKDYLLKTRKKDKDIEKTI